MLIGTAVAGALAIGLPLSPTFGLFLIALVLIGFTFAININCLNIILQTRVDHAHLGRLDTAISHSLSSTYHWII